jgi:hypothetical protein
MPLITLDIFVNICFLAIGIILGRVLMAIQYEAFKPKNLALCEKECLKKEMHKK